MRIIAFEYLNFSKAEFCYTLAMLEKHPFSPFVPKNAKYLILGSFVGKMTPENRYDWYYGTKRNQFWRILSEVYKVKFLAKSRKEKLFSGLGIAITDVIYSCERKSGTNLDNNLTKIVYNHKAIQKIFSQRNIKKVFFSSRFVEKEFRKHFKDIILNYPKVSFIVLPSPSPRFASMNILEKIKVYKKFLPHR